MQRRGQQWWRAFHKLAGLAVANGGCIGGSPPVDLRVQSRRAWSYYTAATARGTPGAAQFQAGGGWPEVRAVDGVVGGGWDGENFFLGEILTVRFFGVNLRRSGGKGKGGRCFRAVVMFQKR